MSDEAGPAPVAPRRIVLLDPDDPHGGLVRVLEELRGREAVLGLPAALRRHAGENPQSAVAAEWLGPLGWVRFLWRGAAWATKSAA